MTFKNRGYLLPEILSGYGLKSFCFELPDNPEYRQAFWGAVWQLGEARSWEKTEVDDNRNEIAAQYWREVLWPTYQAYLANTDECAAPEANTCKTYPPSAAFIQWFPNDAVYTPELVGEGYNYPAWYFATLASNIAYGSQYGDIITSLDRFPPGSLPDILPASGLPRFRINVTGAGNVKAKLVNMFGGSLVQTTIDDDLGTLNFVDVAKDEVAAPPETNGELIVEFNLTTPGAHHIDFIVISWLNSSVPFLHHGGGLRSVELCGFDEMPIYSPPFRFTEECGLEFYDGETWQAVTGWTDFAPDCFQGLPGATGATGAPGAPGTPGTDGTDGSDAQATMIRDTGSGQLQTSPTTPVSWTDVTNAKYLHINADNDPLIAGLDIDPTSLSDIALRLRYTAQPTSNPFQYIVNTVGRSFITPQGAFLSSTSGNTISMGASGSPGIGIVRSGVNAGIQSNITTALDFYFNSILLHRVHDKGRMTFGGQPTNPLYQIGAISQDATFVGADIKGAASQSANLQNWRKSDDVILAKVTSDGRAAFGANDASANSHPDVILLSHESSATPIADFGLTLRMQGKSSTFPARDMALLRAVWETATDATRKAKVTLSVFDTAEREVLSGQAYTGGVPALGFLGASPSPKLTWTGDVMGNAALSNLGAILEVFGLIVDSTTDTGIPDAGTGSVCDLDRCSYADVTAQWMAKELWYKAGFEGGRYDPLADQIARYQDVMQRCEIVFSDYDALYDFVGNQYGDFSGDGTADVNLIAFLLDGMTYIQTTIAERLYCAMDDCGFVSSANFALWISSISPGSDLETRIKDLLLCIDVNGLATMIALASHSQYRDSMSLNCSEIDCAGWSHFYAFAVQDYDPEVFSLVSGSYTGSGYESYDGSTLRIEAAFHIVYAQMTVRVEDDSPPDEILIVNLTTTATTSYTPHSGSNDIEWSGDSVDGLAFILIAPATKYAHIIHISITGLGTEPSI